jgi:hypothetical protein
MSVIYAPHGRAAEYAPLALNIYTGCTHACTYCYAPHCLGCDPAAFHAKATPRPNLSRKLRRDAEDLTGDRRPILLSFTSDPYQPIEEECRATSYALAILREWGLHARILTKNPRRALTLDGEMLSAAGFELGATLTCDDAHAAQVEPGAPPTSNRMAALQEAHERGITTWASIEPVMWPAQALDIIERSAPYVGTFKIGPLNHAPLPEPVCWPAFVEQLMPMLERLGCHYYIKDDLWMEASVAAKAKWPKQRLPGEPRRMAPPSLLEAQA